MVHNVDIRNQIVHQVQVLDLNQGFINDNEFDHNDFITFIRIDRAEREILSRYT